ncbi:MAG: hypothetical protein RBS08_00695 [Bdellovibrionales bacterium]|jgi:hypothetical protein|nr:hypothetical protein [Bdellovibrionales bacterium]
MGYFDGLTDAAFKTDVQGRQVFYPWGVMGKGYVLRDAEHHASLRGKIKLMYMVTLPLIIFNQVVFGFIANLIFLPVYIIWYLVMLRVWTGGLEISSEKITIAEARRNSAKSHNRGTLIFFVIVSVIFVLLGLLMMADGHVVPGLICSVFFGGCGWMIGQMLRDKSKQKALSDTSQF